MLRKIVAIFFLVLLCMPMHEAFAQQINWGNVHREHRVYEPGAFIGVRDRDMMAANAEVYVGPYGPGTYEVHLTSGPSGPVDMYLTHYREIAPGVWEYVSPFPLVSPPPGPAWEDVTYTFELVHASDKSPVIDVAKQTCYIPSGDVTDPVPIPSWVDLSGDCSQLLIEWEDVLENCTDGSYTGHYQIRVYPLNPDGSFNYVTWLYLSGKFPCPEFTLYDACVNCKSYAIGVASRINRTGADPLGGGLVNRSQYYFRYDACYTNVDIDIKPGSYPNCFNSDGKGAIPVAILSSDDFDATLVNPSSISLNGQGVRIVGKGNIQSHIEDVNGDGLDDLMVQIEDMDGTYGAGNAIAVLTGETFGGDPMKGTDSICIVP